MSNKAHKHAFFLSRLEAFSDSPKVSIQGEWIRRVLCRAENHGEGRGSEPTSCLYPLVRAWLVETSPVPVLIPGSNLGLNLGVSQTDVTSAEPAWAAIGSDRWT
jgi:hypothetical protein